MVLGEDQEEMELLGGEMPRRSLFASDVGSTPREEVYT